MKPLLAAALLSLACTIQGPDGGSRDGRPLAAFATVFVLLTVTFFLALRRSGRFAAYESKRHPAGLDRPQFIPPGGALFFADNARENADSQSGSARTQVRLDTQGTQGALALLSVGAANVARGEPANGDGGSNGPLEIGAA
jgi:hypothetical protein